MGKRFFLFLILAIGLTSLLSGCRDFKQVDFYVINQTDEEIEVSYRVRSCMGNAANCFPITRSTEIAPNDSTMLIIQDQVTDDYEIEESFFDFTLTKGDKKSNYKFWNSDKLTQEVFEEHIMYVLTVDNDFF